MVDFCFKNWDRLPSLVTRCWKVEKVEEFVAHAGKSRMTLLHEALDAPCVCGDKWVPCAQNLLAMNQTNPDEWVQAVLYSLENGRSKGTLICHAGLPVWPSARSLWRGQCLHSDLEICLPTGELGAMQVDLTG
eukprot:7992085-Karenia_brevis.AAC.1